MKKEAINPINSLSPFFGAMALVLTFVLTPIPIDTAQAQQSATEQEVYAIGVDAYLYFYSLVTMEITRKQLASRSQRVLQPLLAPLCSEVRSADRQMESAAGHEGSGAPGLGDAVKASWSADVAAFDALAY